MRRLIIITFLIITLPGFAVDVAAVKSAPQLPAPVSMHHAYRPQTFWARLVQTLDKHPDLDIRLSLGLILLAGLLLVWVVREQPKTVINQMTTMSGVNPSLIPETAAGRLQTIIEPREFDEPQSADDIVPRQEDIEKYFREDDEYDYMGSMESMPAKLDLARAYIDMDDPESAVEVLQEILTKGTPEQREEAQEILAQIDSHH